MILMFNPTNLDEVCVQATHIETKGKNTKENFSKKSFKPDEKKFKGKWKSKHTATLKKEGDKPTCTHCQKKGHDASKCWKLHPELKPEKFRKKEDKKTNVAVIQHDLGSDSGDETKVIATSIQGNIPSCFVSRNEPVVDERKRSELFHIRVISKHTKIDTLFYSGSQANLISKEIVKKLQSETKLHPKPYPLGWVCDNA
jgi:hypothetical protein